MLKILMVISEAPPVTSGIARVALQLTAGLEALGHRVDVISVNDAPRFVIGEFRISSMLLRAPRLLLPRLQDYDIVHIHGPVPTFSDIALLLSGLASGQSKPALVYTHHCEIDIDGYGLLCNIYNWMHKNLTRLADQIIVTTPSYADELARFIPRPHIAVVPWGVEADWYLPQRAKAEQFTVLFVGQLRPYKGVDILLRAVAQLDGVRLQIIGNGHREQHYRNLARQLGVKDCTFRRGVSDPQLHAALAEAHVIALPSTTRAEAFGLVLLEGMVAGCVPIVSQLPGVTDVVGEAGLSFPVGDADALAAAIAQLRDDPVLLASYSRSARERVQRFSWQRTAYWHQALYSRCLTLDRFRSLVAQPAAGDQALMALLDDVVTTLGASSGSIMLVEPEVQVLQLRAMHGARNGIELGARQPLESGVAGFVASHNVPLLLPDQFTSVTASGFVQRPERDEIISAVSAPISAGDQSLGVINISSYDPDRRFDDDDLEWSASLARRVGSILAESGVDGARALVSVQ